MIEIRKLEKRDSEDFLRMAKEFYSGPGVLHEVDPMVIKRTLDEMLSQSPFLEGFIFEKEGK
ncbi:MAG: GNAT family N-acetyltransferase, partial [Clostridia bacterium]|nr:GNAT family N-acetyltransferase [Clostridia bacterium]